ncbi:hypothetical protein PF010_g10539 [Phytophthora fragariae]|uniref:Uncharacterized protein n=1 Tax=Phytophthora fragariae TaxID=53985 RepID=A0A6G0L9G5_9STRA|nr:hypothetical protein PF010_g10539 [Phytophthora fragariae]
MSKSDPAVTEDASAKETQVAEEKVMEMSTPEKEKPPMLILATEASAPVKNETGANGDQVSVEGGSATERDVEAPTKPSKEEILATIDVLDSDITGMKKQIKALQRTIASAEVKQVGPSKPVNMEVVSVAELLGEPDSAVATAKLVSAAAEPGVEDFPVSSTDASNISAGQALFTSPVKVAVDSKFVELLAGVFSDNLRKTAAANEQLPKRMEQGRLATKIYHQPSDYAFYQANINRGSSISDQVRLKVDGIGSTASSGEGASTGASEVISALDLVSGSDHTPCVRPPSSEVAVQLDDIVNSGDSDTSDEEKFNLYTQQLEQFIAGQQRPFLVDYASLLSDNSFSTGYEVSTLSIEERLKKYPTPSKELESAVSVVAGSSAGSASQEVTLSKGKQQSHATGSSGNSKNGGSHLTKKELKQQRKLKKMQDGAATAVVATTPTAAQNSSQPVGNTGGDKSGNNSRKKVSQGGKKTNRSGGGTPASRRNSQQPNATNVSPKTSAVTSSATATGIASISAPVSGSTKKGAGGNITPHAKSTSPSANASGSSNANAAAPAKRVVQKWTDGEKAEFLKYFSQYGKDWATLTENIPTKTAAQIKNYYQNYKNRLNLQDILKRRIENAATSGTAKGAAHPGAASAGASGNMVASPRSAAAGLMSGTLRQMGRSVELPGGISMGMPSGSMAMGVSDNNMSFQAALNAAQPGMHNVGVLSELSANQFGLQAHQDPQQQQQQSREMINPASNPERYLKLLNMQHQLQIMQFQQQQKSQGVASESTAAGSNNTPYHEGQMSAANAQRLYQFSRQQQHQVPPQHLSLQALQQLGLSSHPQASSHSQMMQQQHQARGSYAEMGHPNNMYQSMAQMQTQQHSQAMTTSGQIGLSPTSVQQYDRPVDTSTSVAEDGMGAARGNVEGAPNQMGRHDNSQRSMMNMSMMNNGASGNVGTISQATSSPRRPPVPPPRPMPIETSRPADVESRRSAWQSSPASLRAAKRSHHQHLLCSLFAVGCRSRRF